MYNPDPDQELALTLEAEAGPESWPVRLKKGNDVLARWAILPGVGRTYTSPPIRLDGVQELIFERDGDRPPSEDLIVNKLSLERAGAGIRKKP